MWGVSISFKKSILGFGFSFLRRLLFPWCTPKNLSLSQLSEEMSSAMWFLTIQKKWQPIFSNVWVPTVWWKPLKEQSHLNLAGCTLSPFESTSSSFPFPWVCFICLNTFKFAYFSNLFSPLWAMQLFILWFSSLLFTFPHNEYSLKHFKWRPLLSSSSSPSNLPIWHIFNSYHRTSGSMCIIFC